MKINPEKTKNRLKNIPGVNAVFIYDATIILEFFRSTFMPTEMFLQNPDMLRRAPQQLSQKSFKPGCVREHRYSLDDLYTWYQMFRNQKPYTKTIETRYRFGMIIRKMRFYKNGVELVHQRVGTGQINYFGPLLLRAKAPQEMREQYPIPVIADEVEMDQQIPVQAPVPVVPQDDF